MGAGKTTVVSPLLSMLLANGSLAAAPRSEMQYSPEPFVGLCVSVVWKPIWLRQKVYNVHANIHSILT